MPLPSFRLSLRFILPLILVLALGAWLVVPLMDALTLRWSLRDLDTRSRMLVAALQEPLAEYASDHSTSRIRQLFDHAIEDDRLVALAFCNTDDEIVVSTAAYPAALGCRNATSGEALRRVRGRLPQGPLRVADLALGAGATKPGKLVLVQDLRFLERRSADSARYLLLFVGSLALAVSAITALVAHLSWRGWMKSVRGLLQGELMPLSASGATARLASPEMQPLVGDVRALMREYHLERLGAPAASEMWTADKLRTLLAGELAGDQVLVVSNREPYIHIDTPNGIEVRRPASGLVTAVEAVMRACSGTWIAHGSGSADRKTVDRHDHVRVPPDNPSYTLRRVWLSADEELGYYYGFANEGLWPLCHIAHVRPVFRTSDWDRYVEVNRRFADAVVSEAQADDPVVLVQDYHFALLPRMVREALPKATIITFWHIPWPNSESFGICPWREQLLDGLLGSTLLGFHTPFHRKNFLDSVDRYLEARIETEASTISYGGALTQVANYPISIAWPEPDDSDNMPAAEVRAAVRTALGLAPNCLMGIGVDRLDYTKGILERFQAIERMLELNPAMVGKFSFVQIAAPSRSSLEEYRAFETRVVALAQRINQRFGQTGYAPIVLKTEHHEQEQLHQLYRAADVCMVTSLHDGMNLVAKEFIAARSDDSGVLILSQFTGASRELHEALLINPYHIEEGATALLRALTMPAIEQRERMRSMRALVRNFNVYRWAGHMLRDAARLRQRERVMSKIHSHSRRSRRQAG